MLEAQAAYEARGPRLRRSTPSPSPATAASSTRYAEHEQLAARASPCGTGSAAAPRTVSAVGLLPRCAAGHRHRRHARRRARHGRGRRAATTRAKNPAALLALMWYYAGDGARREGHGRPAVQGPARAVLPLPPAARDGVARQGARPRRQGRAPGHRRLRQQGLDRPARLRAAAARGREQLLRHLHRGAARIARGRATWRSSRASPAATTCRASCSARAARSTRTAASRITLTVPARRRARTVGRAHRAVRARGRASTPRS